MQSQEKQIRLSLNPNSKRITFQPNNILKKCIKNISNETFVLNDISLEVIFIFREIIFFSETLNKY